MDSITLDDVAREAGVSPSTVSRVLSGSARVSAKKERVVLEVVRRLGYTPNALAQGLARGQSLSVGVIIQEVSSPFYGELARGIEESLRSTPYYPVFVSGHWRTDLEHDALQVLLRQRVDALIVTGGHLPDPELHQQAKKRPLVIVSRNVKGLEANCLCIDNVQGGYLGTRHLIELGHRRIAHIRGPDNVDDAGERFEGYRQALSEAQIPFDTKLVVQGEYQERSGLMGVETLLARGVPFSAIFCANDQTAYGARLALFRRGIRVPDDVSLVGFDDVPASSYQMPPLTTVRQPGYEMGQAAGKLVLEMINKQTVQSEVLATSLVIRESTARARS
jgi:LacI family transcriptional regulator